MTEFQAWVQVGVTMVLTLITVGYVIQSFRQSSASIKAVEEMRLTRKAQARARIAVELWPWDRRFSMFDLAIRDYGASAARDIRIVFDEGVKNPQVQGNSLNDLGVLKNLPILLPNEEFLLFVGTKPWLLAPGIPRLWSGKAFFTDDAGEHEEPVEINVGIIDGIDSYLPGPMPKSAPQIRRGWGSLQEPEEQTRMATLRDLPGQG